MEYQKIFIVFRISKSNRTKKLNQEMEQKKLAFGSSKAETETAESKQ